MKPDKTIQALADLFPTDGDAGPLMRLVVNQVAQTRGLKPPWDIKIPAPQADRAVTLLADLGDTGEWGAHEFGVIYEQVVSAAKREQGGIWYTPPLVADSMVTFSIGPQLDRLDDPSDPGNLLQVLALDPSCGAGVFLVSAARLIARRYAGRIGRTTEPTDWMIRMVMPEVMSECIFGIDIDPVAVDMAKSVCWLEMGGTQSITFMDRNIICGNPLNNVSPPKLEERYGAPVVEDVPEAIQGGLFSVGGVA